MRLFIFITAVLLVNAICGNAQSLGSVKHKSKIAYINNLPALRATAYKRAKVKWECGSTAAMIEGSQQYEAELVKMCAGVASRYYPKNHFGPGGIEKLLTKEMNSLGKLELLINDVGGDGGGTINGVLAEGEAMGFLENTIKKLVNQVCLNEEFDYGRWEKEWNKCENIKPNTANIPPPLPKTR